MILLNTGNERWHKTLPVSVTGKDIVDKKLFRAVVEFWFLKTPRLRGQVGCKSQIIKYFYSSGTIFA